MREQAKAYEIGYLVKGEEGAGLLSDHLKRAEAEILSPGGIRPLKLSYPILHQPAAYFGYIHFELDPDSVKGLSDALKLDNQILRFLIVTPPFTKERRGLEVVPPAKRVAKPITEPTETVAASNDLLEEKLEEILNK